MPAAAVIPAPIAYIKVVAVKKLVVELWAVGRTGRLRTYSCLAVPFFLEARQHLCCRDLSQDCYLEKIRVFKAGDLLE